ncbi:alpha-amylase family glycosyl hydrolase [Dokdonia sp. Hel_I_53]|uniref:alpha-amylase family glycosyl hydrolase n=1 Tax=Dokdonia sp. Hel_I_53 TaxID=1566287 RepID=UPI00119A14D6|nr:alpha-amylase family glycosyl hydrolase [Dokdonia sp. Hel_I_53]TVZ51812.1 alpha-amylase [Dokdonia sp. Hel_I_53]
MNSTLRIIILIFFICISCQYKETSIQDKKSSETSPFFWEAANMYFLLTDRFYNGTTSNDVNFDRTRETGVLRGFKGGDLIGIRKKIEEGYFTDLGINAIWFTPVVEQIHDVVDEGTGPTYGYHGYWAKDWTALDPNFGTREDLKAVVDEAHKRGIRIVMDVVLNHTGPVTIKDPFWGEDWARENPNCKFSTYENTTACSLVENLPDILTESNVEVMLPETLIKKWKKEGRYKQEIEELDDYFAINKLSKTPRNYIIKWLTDFIEEFGIDAFRVDTTKHVDEASWVILREQSEKAFNTYKSKNPKKVLDDIGFFMFGEVYNYSIDNGREYDFGDKKVDYFENGFDNLINFQFKYDAENSYEDLFSKYASLKDSVFSDKSFVNYATSHDDGQPFDKNRTRSKEIASKLLLTTGISQIYYGDETGRDLTIEGANGDATLRSFMNWEDLKNPQTQELLSHWQKLGRFRIAHPAIGAGKHKMISEEPYIFRRYFEKNGFKDEVIVGLELPIGTKVIELNNAFAKAEHVTDTYSGKTVPVIDGEITLDTPYGTVLLEIAKN